MTVDTRLAQMAAAIDDARILAADIQEQTTCPPLSDARQYLNWALSAIDRAAAVLADRNRNNIEVVP